MVNQLPQGWKKEELGKLGVATTGGTPSKSNSEYYGSDVLWVKPSELKDFADDPYIIDTPEKLSIKGAEKVRKVPKGSVLICCIGSIGKMGVASCDVRTNQQINSIKFFDNVIDDKLGFYACYFKKNEFIQNASNAVVPILNKTSFEKIKIIYPTDKGEQKYIVDTLDAVAEMIKLRKETIDLTKKLIPAIFQEMFGDPITNPKGWEMKTFREVLTIKNGKSQKDVENANGIYPIYGSAGEIMGYANDFICNENSVIIGRKGNINSPKLIKTKFWNVDTAFGLEPNKGLNYNYLYVFCLLYDFEKHNRAVVIPSLVKSDLLEIKIPFPVLSMQEEFSDRIEQINQNLEVQQKDLDRLQELFDQLLQKAFTGELTRGEDYGKH